MQMRRTRPRVKDLARELGLTSRQLLDRCREAEIQVQNSISKFSVEDERIVRSWFRESDCLDEPFVAGPTDKVT